MARKKNSAGNKEEGTKIARVYIRVSHQGERGKGKGKGEFISPEMQLEAAKAYVQASLPDYVLDEEASLRNADINRSAFLLPWRKRDGLVRHLEEAKRGEFSTLVVFKLSRLARNTREGLELYDKFEKAGCSILSVRDHIDLSTATGQVLLSVTFAFNQLESEGIREWAKAVSFHRAEQGKIIGAPPFWINKKEDGSFELNERYPTIRRLVELRLLGFSYPRIARTLNAEGFTASEGGVWRNQMVCDALRPDRLLRLQGHYVYGNGLEDDDPERIITRDLYPAVITPEEAELLQGFNRRMSQMYAGGKSRRAADTQYVLSGLLWCSQCNGKMRSRTCSGKGQPLRRGYLCNLKHDTQIPHPAGSFVSSTLLEEAVLRVVFHATTQYQAFSKCKPKVIASKPSGTPLDKQIEKQNERIQLLSKLYYDGTLAEEDFKPQYEELRKKRDALKAQLDAADAQLSIYHASLDVIKDLSNSEITAEQARRLILTFVEKVEAPILIEKNESSTKNGYLKRGAWITLRIPLPDGTRRIFAPFYSKNYEGERIIIPDQQAPPS